MEASNGHKSAEVALKESEDRFHFLTKSAIDSIIIADALGNITFWNDSAHKMFGYTSEEVIGKSLSIIMPDKYKEAHDKGMQRFIDSGKTTMTGRVIELEGKRKDDSIFPIELSLSAWETEGQKHFSGIIRDTTTRTEAVSSARSSDLKFKALYNQAYIGIAKVSLKGQFLDVNDRLCGILGYAPEELCQKSFHDITHPDDLEMSEEFRTKFITGIVNKVTFEKRYFHKNGSVLNMSITVNSVKDLDGASDYFVTVFEDITERKKSETTIKDSLAEKELLLKEVHHRVKNNMQLITSMMNLYASKVADDKVTTALNECKNNIYSLALVHDSLYKTGDLVNMNFSDYLFQLCQHFQSTMSGNGRIRIQTELTKTRVSINNAITCGLIVNELLTNAYKHAFPDQQEGTVTVGLTSDDDLIQISISDNGVGLPGELCANSANSFGLEMVCTLASQLSGKIETFKEKGTKFVLTFSDEPVDE